MEHIPQRAFLFFHGRRHRSNHGCNDDSAVWQIWSDLAENVLCERGNSGLPRCGQYSVDVSCPIDPYQTASTDDSRPLAIKFGRRPVYLLSNTLMGIACIWLGIASNVSYTPFIVGRAFLGLFEAPIESIVPSTITDVFFLHNRGARISMYGLSVLGGNELGPLVSFQSKSQDRLRKLTGSSFLPSYFNRWDRRGLFTLWPPLSLSIQSPCFSSCPRPGFSARGQL